MTRTRRPAGVQMRIMDVLLDVFDDLTCTAGKSVTADMVALRAHDRPVFIAERVDDVQLELRNGTLVDSSCHGPSCDKPIRIIR